MSLKLPIIALTALTLSACSSWVRDLSDLVHSTPMIVDSLGHHAGSGLIAGVRDTLTGELSKRKFAELLDTVMAHLDANLRHTGISLRDSLLGQYTKDWVASLKDEMIGTKTKSQLATLRDELLGAKTSALLQRLIHQDLLGPATTRQLNNLVSQGIVVPLTDLLDNLEKHKIPGLRDSLLGPKTQAYIDSLLSHSLTRLDTALINTNVRLKDQESFLTKNITAILLTLGGIVAVLILLGAWVGRHAYRQRQIINVLTSQIEAYTTRTQDKTLTESIKMESKKAGTEGYLNKLLVNKGLVKG